MRFISEIEARTFFAKLGIEPSQIPPGDQGLNRFKSDTLFYHRGVVAARAIAVALTHVAGRFANSVVWPLGSVSQAKDEHHQAACDAFKQWRREHNAPSSIRNTPPLALSADEGLELTQLLEFAMLLRWNALVGFKPATLLFEFSCDDRIVIYWCLRPKGLGSLLSTLSATRR
jgi:hypothetical protein